MEFEKNQTSSGMSIQSLCLTEKTLKFAGLSKRIRSSLGVVLKSLQDGTNKQIRIWDND
jgi:hypothetical protein